MIRHLHYVQLVITVKILAPRVPIGRISRPIGTSLFSFTVSARLSMAWRCSGNTNNELVDNLHENGIIKSQRIVEAMKATDRKVCLL